MSTPFDPEFTRTARREFLKFLAASPYVAALGGVAAFCEQTGLAQALAPEAKQELIKSPKEALDVFDFEEVAHRNVMPGHWAYMASGVDDDGTLHANRDAFQDIQLRPRRLRDATKTDMRVTLFDRQYASPIFCCPTSAQRAFSADGELDVARAAKSKNTLQWLSSAMGTPIEEVVKQRGEPVVYQLYAPSSWDACQKMLQRAWDAGCRVVALTCDNTTGRFSETYLRNRPKDLKQCLACHAEGEPGTNVHERRIYDGIDMKGVTLTDPAMDWTYAKKIRAFWKGKFFIKGIDTREDARLAVDAGLDGILVSNHGGRSTETLRATVVALPEVVREVDGRVPVFVDGGFRRGTDVFKALALGATAVGIGRPQLWGLGAFGQAGVERVLEIMQGELKLCMGNCGTRTPADITRDYVTSPDLRL